MRQEMQHDLRRFTAAAEPQMTAYVVETHRQLSSQVQDRIVENYQERVKGTVRLLTGGDGSRRAAR